MLSHSWAGVDGEMPRLTERLGNGGGAFHKTIPFGEVQVVVFVFFLCSTESVLVGSLRALRGGRGRPVLAAPSALGVKQGSSREGEGEQGAMRPKKKKNIWLPCWKA